MKNKKKVFTVTYHVSIKKKLKKKKNSRFKIISVKSITLN